MDIFVCVYDVFKLSGIHIVAGADDHSLCTASEVDEALAVHRAEVAGVDPCQPVVVLAQGLCAAAAAGGDIELRGVESRHFSRIKHFLNYAGCDIISTKRSVRLISDGKLQAVGNVITEPYPGFPTDAQPLLMAAMLKARGRTVFTENIFDSRYCHAKELKRFGADIAVCDRNAEVWGVRELCGAAVNAADLRGGAALIIAGLSANGSTVVTDAGHIERGYEHFDYKLRTLGADIYMEY